MFHRLAPMDGVMSALTTVLLLVPVGMAGAAFWNHLTPLLGVAALVVAIYAAVFFLARPRGFAVTEGRVEVVFPVWSRAVDGVVKAERVDTPELKRRYGMLLRVGAGGLWGGFGWLWSSKGWLEFYISRMDGYVLLTRNEGLPLLISPEDPDAFCERVAAD